MNKKIISGNFLIYSAKKLYNANHFYFINNESTKIKISFLLTLFIKNFFLEPFQQIKEIYFIKEKLFNKNSIIKLSRKEIPLIIFYIICFSKLLKSTSKIKKIISPHPSLSISKALMWTIYMYEKNPMNCDIYFILPGCGRPDLDSIKYIRNFNSHLFVPTNNLSGISWINEESLVNINVKNFIIKRPEIFYEKLNYLIFLGYNKQKTLYVNQFISIVVNIFRLNNLFRKKRNYLFKLFLHPRISFLKILNCILNKNFVLTTLNTDDKYKSSVIFSFSPSISPWLFNAKLDKRISVNYYEGKDFLFSHSILQEFIKKNNS